VCVMTIIGRYAMLLSCDVARASRQQFSKSYDTN
jgi:hypothetical protein